MDHNTTLYNTIARYVSGEASREEVIEIKAKMKNEPEFAEMVGQFKHFKSVRRASIREMEVEKAWSRLEKKMEATQGAGDETLAVKPMSALPLHDRTQWRNGRAVWIARFAAILMIAGLTFLFLFMNKDILGDNGLETQQVVTQPGQRSNIHLKDGSRILVNTSSMISYKPFHDNIPSRVITLSGEAYFDVAAEERPFYVHADDVVIQVLGTEFSVRSYQNEDIHIVVASGSVSVMYKGQADKTKFILEKGDKISMPRNQNGSPIVTRDIDLEKHLGWMHYRFYFDDATLADVANELERAYGVEIHFADPDMGNRRISTRFEGESIHKVLGILRLALNMDYETDGASIRFVEKQHDSNQSF